MHQILVPGLITIVNVYFGGLDVNISNLQNNMKPDTGKEVSFDGIGRAVRDRY